jgi:NAD(P)-dependent dehydrogenase (short-subunit alcohol dehydrogenase family)
MNVNKSSLFDLNEKTVVITGGAGLIAKEYAKVLSNHGAEVILVDSNEIKCNEVVLELNKLGYKVSGYFCDVGKKSSWELLLEFVISSAGKVDVLINNASFTNQSKSKEFDFNFEDTALEDWNSIIDVNLTGTFLGCQVFGKYFLEHGKGNIINISSLYGVVSPHHKIYPGTGIFQPAAYSVSKHGVIGLTKFLATLWAERGIRVNALTPGGVFNGHSGPFFEKYKELNPSGRMCQPTELCGGIVYLASDASSHVVGHNLIIDGGWSVW